MCNFGLLLLNLEYYLLGTKFENNLMKSPLKIACYIREADKHRLALGDRQSSVYTRLLAFGNKYK